LPLLLIGEVVWTQRDAICRIQVMFLMIWRTVNCLIQASTVKWRHQSPVHVQQ
jgi:hypothetical protein